jgi:TolB-like protein
MRMSFFDELKRRNVIKVAAAYVIVGWLIMQAGEVLSPALHLPGWVNSALAFFLILGFPLALVFAWAFEMTPDGIKKEKDVDRSKSIASATGKKLNLTIIMVLVLALGLFAIDKFVLDPGRDAEEIATAVQDARKQASGSIESSESEQVNDQEPAISHLSIAVLPFDNRSNREEDQFFTDGMHDDLLTTIAKIGSMKVISRTSVMEYRDTVKKIPEIAKELGVANILEGGIQRSGNQVRINVQLIDAATDEHLWAEIYDRELTAENLFAIQSEISKAIANALQTTLSPEEERRIDTVATDNLAALEAYLRGRQLMATRDSANLELAVEEFNKAVELDPKFALAWVGVADSNMLFAAYGGLTEENFYAIREEAIDRALAIDDRLGEAYASLGMLYQSRGLNEDVEAAFKQAIQLSPNYATGWQWYSIYLAKYPLRSNEKIALLNKAAELDPRSSIIGMNLATEYRIRGLYSMAERQYLKVIELDPGFIIGYRSLIGFYNKNVSRFDQAFKYALKVQELVPEDVRSLFPLFDIYLNLGDITAAENILERMRELDADHRNVGFADVLINLQKNNPAGAHETFNWLLPKMTIRPQRMVTMGYFALVLGDKARARELYLSAFPGWADPGQWPELINLSENDGCIVAWIFSNTGDEKLGQQLLQQSTLRYDETLPAITEHTDLYLPETCYLTGGDTEKALQTIETQLAHNHLYDWELNHQLPMYDLIRHEPRYQAALAERERRISIQRETIATMVSEADS